MGFISKVELKRQLVEMGVKVEGNYVRRKDLEKITAASKQGTGKVLWYNPNKGFGEIEEEDGTRVFLSKEILNSRDSEILDKMMSHGRSDRTVSPPSVKFTAEKSGSRWSATKCKISV